MNESKKKKITINVDEVLYCEYKKALIDKRTTPTADFTRHMQDVLKDAHNSHDKEVK